MSSASRSLCSALLALQQRDLTVREELDRDGSLHEGYHPRMEAVHLENAGQLRGLIERFGWPNEGLAGADGAEAAWLIAQHAISEPDFMRACRRLLESEVASGGVPTWQLACLDDRIRVSEGRPQRFGTQFKVTPDGPELCEVEDPALLDERRLQAGLSPAAGRLRTMRSTPRPTAAEFAARQREEMAWRVKVGWCTPDDT
jgi:hypothetical protein